MLVVLVDSSPSPELCEDQLYSWQWRAVVKMKAHRGKNRRIMGNEHFTGGMREYFTLKGAEAKRMRDGAAGGRSKKENKVSGSRNLHSGRSWSRPEEMKM